MSEYTILPLINAAFQPGEAKKTVDSFEDRDFQEIARAEYYYFTGQAEECNHIAERYLMSNNIKLKMSSCLLYVYSNLTLGRKQLNSWRQCHCIKLHIRKFIHRKMQKHRGHISRKYTDSPVLSG